MTTPREPKPEILYVESLRWRQSWLRAELDSVQGRIEDLNREEATLTVQLRAVEQLLSVEQIQMSNGVQAAPSHHLERASAEPTDKAEGSSTPSAEDDQAVDWSVFGPKSRKIYVATANVLREAGVPLHYRVLADEVQKQVPLAGTDPGATLIAHLHRAQHLFPRIARGVYGLGGAKVATTEGPTEATAEVPVTRRVRRKTARRRRSR
jgi:hypothetical protein